jgi:hypothetical protein
VIDQILSGGEKKMASSGTASNFEAVPEDAIFFDLFRGNMDLSSSKAPKPTLLFNNRA